MSLKAQVGKENRWMIIHSISSCLLSSACTIISLADDGRKENRWLIRN